jgi:hypothetical protein
LQEPTVTIYPNSSSTRVSTATVAVAVTTGLISLLLLGVGFFGWHRGWFRKATPNEDFIPKSELEAYTRQMQQECEVLRAELQGLGIVHELPAFDVASETTGDDVESLKTRGSLD